MQPANVVTTDSVLEIERKFVCTPDLVSRFEKLAHNVERMEFCDSYYDDSSFSLTTHDLWLRKRNNTLELKWPHRAPNSHSENNVVNTVNKVDCYNESTNWDYIQEYICSITGQRFVNKGENDVEDKLLSLAAGGFKCFGKFMTTRNRYHIRLSVNMCGCNHTVEVYADVDRVDFFTPSDIISSVEYDGVTRVGQYHIGEIELLSSTYTSDPRDALHAVFTMLQLPTDKIRSKVLEYIRQHRPEHCKALEKAGVVI
mmetsp:Transcript_20945/g.30193  ORF Transcript_20945/g.30193 Transcript_20945/m.30193 type:complete len:256 (-) Transcript_20945:204-971(-)